MDEPLEVLSASNLAVDIKKALLHPGNLCVDLQEASRIHTAVLQVLVATQRSCRESKRFLAISGGTQELQVLLQLAGLKTSNLACESIQELP